MSFMILRRSWSSFSSSSRRSFSVSPSVPAVAIGTGAARRSGGRTGTTAARRRSTPRTASGGSTPSGRTAAISAFFFSCRRRRAASSLAICAVRDSGFAPGFGLDGRVRTAGLATGMLFAITLFATGRGAT